MSADSLSSPGVVAAGLDVAHLLVMDNPSNYCGPSILLGLKPV